MSRLKLYRARGNNGVHVVLTGDGYAAHQERGAYFDTHETYDGLDPAVTCRLAKGTMTFAPAHSYILPGRYKMHYGTYEMMDALLALCDITTVAETVYVPFSNGSRAAEDELRDGYGFDRGRFEALVNDALDGIEADREDSELFHSGGPLQ